MGPKTPANGLMARILFLLCCHCAAGKQGSALFDLLTTDCPSEPLEAPAVAAPSEPECVLRCTLDAACRLSVYLSHSARCHSLPASPPSNGSCGSNMIARRKLSAAVHVASSSAAAAEGPLSVNFSSQAVLWYNFRKSFDNLVNKSLYRAEPVNIAEQSPVDGVRLQGSNSSFVKVPTPGFYRYFFFEKPFSVFFQGKFSCDSAAKCINSLVDVNNLTQKTLFFVKGDGDLKISAVVPSNYGSFYVYNRTWFSACANDSVERLVSFGINFAGTRFLDFAYRNGSEIRTVSSVEREEPKILENTHDNLLIGNCMTEEIRPFDGWLQCWALLTGNLNVNEFDQMRDLCSR